MTLKIIIEPKCKIYVYTQSRFIKKVRCIETFDIPYSFEEFKIWLDIRCLNFKRISFEVIDEYRTVLCMITKTKFDSLNFPELEKIKKLMSNES